jgi:hypothetical protein
LPIGGAASRDAPIRMPIKSASTKRPFICNMLQIWKNSLKWCPLSFPHPQRWVGLFKNVRESPTNGFEGKWWYIMLVCETSNTLQNNFSQLLKGHFGGKGTTFSWMFWFRSERGARERCGLSELRLFFDLLTWRKFWGDRLLRRIKYSLATSSWSS